MKRKGIYWGLVLICIAVLLVLESIGTGLGIINGIPILKIILGVGCLAWLGNELYKLKICHIFFPLAFLFLIFESEIAQLCKFPNDNIISNWTVILIALLFTIGTSLILPKKKHDENSEWYFGEHKVYDKNKGGFQITGKATKYFDAAEFVNGHVENQMGETDIFFENSENYAGGGTLTVENRMGSMKIHIPKEWTVTDTIVNQMGNVKIAQSFATKTDGKNITITGKCYMGNITIDYV